MPTEPLVDPEIMAALNAQGGALNALHTRMEALDAKVDALRVDVDALRVDVGNLNHRMDEVLKQLKDQASILKRLVDRNP